MYPAGSDELPSILKAVEEALKQRMEIIQLYDCIHENALDKNLEYILLNWSGFFLYKLLFDHGK